MLKKVRRIIVIALVMIMSIGILCACDNNGNKSDETYKYAEYKVEHLKNMYENGSLSKFDLQIIADYYNANINCDDELSVDIVNKLKEVEVNRTKNENDSINIEVEKIKIANYYGKYNDYYVLIFDNPYYSYPTVIIDELVKIDFVQFHVTKHEPISVIKI